TGRRSRRTRRWAEWRFRWRRTRRVEGRRRTRWGRVVRNNCEAIFLPMNRMAFQARPLTLTLSPEGGRGQLTGGLGWRERGGPGSGVQCANFFGEFSPLPSGFPSPPRVSFPRRDVRFAKRGPPGEGTATERFS